MFYIPILIVCSLAPGFVGDKDSGSTCLQFYDAQQVEYFTFSECQTRLRIIQEEVVARKEKLAIELPRPWHFKGKCVVPVIDEKDT